MGENLDAELLEILCEVVCGALTVVLSDNNRAHEKTYASEKVNKAQHLFIVGDVKVAAKLLFFDSLRTYSDDNLSLILKL